MSERVRGSDDAPQMIVPAEANGYAIEAFGAARWPVARQALMRGYPGSSEAWWQAGFERTQAVPGNAPDQPLGMLLHGPTGIAGVVMLYASRRVTALPGSPQLHVNLSSWAMVPESREQAIWFVRRALHEPDAVYSSLTPITATARILKRMKFQTISHQLVLSVTPRLALSASPAAAVSPRVLGAAATLGALRDDPIHPALVDHDRLGCVVCSVETHDGLLPLVFRCRLRSLKLPVAELIYTPSVAALCAVVRPLSRFLLRRGFPLMEFEANEDAAIDFRAVRLFRRRLASGPYPKHGIDHLYSELVYLHR